METEAEGGCGSRYDYPPELQSEIPPIRWSRAPTNDGRGEAYGVDVYVTRGGPRLSGWLSYTLGWAQRDAYGEHYAFDYDRRHSATLVGSYRFTPRFEVSATARASSGFPRTPFAGVRVAPMEEGLRLVPEYDPEGRLVYEAATGGLDVLNSQRLPFYARLDLRASFRPRGEKGRWQFYVEAINALARKNVSAIEGRSNTTRPAGWWGARPGALPAVVRSALVQRGFLMAWYSSARSFAWSSSPALGRSCVKYTTTSCSLGSTQ